MDTQALRICLLFSSLWIYHSGGLLFRRYHVQRCDYCKYLGEGFKCVTLGRYGHHCFCQGGYTMEGKGRKPQCLDKDECKTNKHECDLSVSKCVNKPGSYLCICNDGYHMNKGECEKLPEEESSSIGPSASSALPSSLAESIQPSASMSDIASSIEPSMTVEPSSSVEMIESSSAAPQESSVLSIQPTESLSVPMTSEIAPTASLEASVAPSVIDSSPIPGASVVETAAPSALVESAAALEVPESSSAAAASAEAGASPDISPSESLDVAPSATVQAGG